MGVDSIMIIRVPRPLTDDEVKREAVKAQIALGNNGVLAVDSPGKYTWRPEGRHCLSIIHGEANENIERRPDETLIDVGLRTRYYGVGYERGDLVSILAVARWFRIAFAPCEIWYGGDNGTVEQLDEVRENDLWVHFMSDAGRAYFSRPPRDGNAIHCTFCDVDAGVFMFSGNESGHVCPSCGQHWRQYGNGRHVLADDKYNPIPTVQE
jgi:hypothetical protein